MRKSYGVMLCAVLGLCFPEDASTRNARTPSTIQPHVPIPVVLPYGRNKPFHKGRVCFCVIIKEYHIGSVRDLNPFVHGSGKTEVFLSLAEKKDRVVNVSYELPKSYILYDFGGEYSVYLSPLNTATLIKRMSE